MSQKSIYLVLYFAALAAGILVWKIERSPFQNAPPATSIDTVSATNAHNHSYVSNSLVTIDNELVTADELDWELSLHTQVPFFHQDDDLSPPSPAAPISQEESTRLAESLKQRLLVTMIERKLLYSWIKDHSTNFDHDNPSRYLSCLSDLKEISESNKEFFGKTRGRERLKARLCEQSLIEQYLHERVYSGLNVTDMELHSWYDAHKEAFSERPKVTFRQVLLGDESTARMVRERITPSNFGEMAKKYSIAAEAADGGRVGPFSKEQLPTFFDIVFRMSIGEISNVVRSDFGYHILMLLNRSPERTLEDSEARANIHRTLMEQRKKEAYQSWLNSAMNAISLKAPRSEGAQ